MATRNLDPLDEDDYKYFSDVLSRLNMKFEDADDKQLYVNNVMQNVSKNEVKLSQHKTLSRKLEQLIPELSPEQLIKFFEGFSKEFKNMTDHYSASHVLQKWIERSCTVVTAIKSDHEMASFNSELTKKILNYSKWVNSNLNELLKSDYACYVICTLLEGLGGYKVLDQILRNSDKKLKPKPNTPLQERVKLNVEFKDIANEIMSEIKNIKDLKALIVNVGPNTVLKTTLLVSSRLNSHFCEEMTEKLISLLFKDSKEIKTPMKNNQITPLIEKVIDVATPDQLASIQEKYFKGKFKKYSLCPTANFLVQHLIKKCPSKEQFEEIYNEISEFWSDISDVGHLGIFVGLSEACKNLNTHQAMFSQRIAELLDCWQPPNRKPIIVPLISRWQSFKQYESFTNQYTLQYHGSLIIQNMLHFQKTFLICDSLLKISVEDLVKLCCDPCGSHIIDNFMRSVKVPEDKKRNLIEKLKEELVTIASDKFGSRCVEEMWRSSPMPLKLIIVEILANKKAKLRNKFGYFVYNLCQLDLFSTQPTAWKQQISGSNKSEKTDPLHVTGKKRSTDITSELKHKRKSSELMPKNKRKRKLT